MVESWEDGYVRCVIVQCEWMAEQLSSGATSGHVAKPTACVPESLLLSLLPLASILLASLQQ